VGVGMDIFWNHTLANGKKGKSGHRVISVISVCLLFLSFAVNAVLGFSLIYRG